MKSIITEAADQPVQSGPRLMRDKRDGQIVLISTEKFGPEVKMVAVSSPSSKHAWTTARTGDLINIDEGNLEPFNGTVTLSNS